MADPTPEFRTWADVERALAGLPRQAVVAFAVRAAARVAPAVARLAGDYGGEAWEWFAAVDATLRAAAGFARGAGVSRFTLGVAAELARYAAAATAAAARTAGPSPRVEAAELAYAAAAFAADAASTPTPARAATLAMQAARAAAGGEVVPAEQRLDLVALRTTPEGPVDPSDTGPLGEKWPAGAPAGDDELWVMLSEIRPELPRLLEPPGGQAW
jgi:hypothetical protein